MTLVDTSVLIDYLRSHDAKLLGLFRSLPGAVCGAVRAEILHGAKTPADRGRLLTFLAPFTHILTPETLWDSVGDLLATLRRRGVTVPFNDAAIAALALWNDVELWTRDAQFQLIQRHAPALRLFTEPP